MTVIHAEQLSSQFTVEEYLAFIATRPDEERWQLIDGVAMMMPPPTKVHQRIGSNIAFALNTHFQTHRPEYYAYQEVGLIVPGGERFRPEADVAVEDSAAAYESYTDKFHLVVEVLSESNTDKDVEIKRQRYMQHPDSHYVLIISQKVPTVMVWARQLNWQPQKLTRFDATLELPEFAFTATLRTIYAGTPVAKA